MPNVRKLRKELLIKGFRKLPQPEIITPKAPINVTELDSKKLGDVVSNYTAWREYTEDLLSQEQINYAIVKHKYDIQYNLKWMSIQKKGTNKDKEIALSVDEELLDLREQVLESELLVEAYSSRIESYSNVLTMLSREITRRTGRNFA